MPGTSGRPVSIVSCSVALVKLSDTKPLVPTRLRSQASPRQRKGPDDGHRICTHCCSRSENTGRDLSPAFSIMARAVMAFEEAQKDSVSAGERTGGLVLGRELADAVLSFASPLAIAEDAGRGSAQYVAAAGAETPAQKSQK